MLAFFSCNAYHTIFITEDHRDTTITLRADAKQKNLITEYAKMHGESMSIFILGTVLDKIEDEIDLHDMEEAVGDHRANPKIYTHDEIKIELGL